jgi:hypothetical protein
MPNVVQGDFSGGMSAFADSTKVPANQYYLGLNTRIRSSGIEGAFRPIEYDSPEGNHQGLFALDDKLILISSGLLYEIVLADRSFRPITTPFAMSASVEFVYHQSVPAPNNFKVNGNVQTMLSTFPEAVVLQDGLNQPGLLGFNLSSRLAKTYGEWQYDTPEYVPIGKQMCSSGNILFIVDPTGRKIYRSVSGRQLDFVLDFNSTTGQKQLDANGTFLAVATAQLNAIHPAQGGGIVAFTKEQSYTLLPDSSADLVFGEIYLRPGDLFPVGVVNHLSFTQANGQTVFVSPSGIQEFNQVAQQLRESNSNPFSAPIFEHLVLPITSTATASAGDYTFFAVSSKFGDGILVYDNQRQVFTGFDLVGRVKEFAVLSVNNLRRVFFITYSNQVFELPIYTGTRRTFHLIVGEYNDTGGSKRVKPGNTHLVFNNVRSSGEIVVETYKDKVLSKRIQQNLQADRTSTNLLSTTPQAFPLGEETQTKPITFDTADGEGFAWGFGISCSADARLISTDIELMTTAVETVNPNLEATEKQRFAFIGELRADVTSTGLCTYAVTVGKVYVFYTPVEAASLTNDKETITTTFAGDAKVFRAISDRIYLPTDAKLLDYETVLEIIQQADRPDCFFLLGNLGFQADFWHIRRLFDYKNTLISAISGNTDIDNSQIVKFSNTFNTPEYYVYETEYVNFYCFRIPLDTTASALNADGTLTNGTPAVLTEDGLWANWLRANILQRDNNKFNIVVWHFPAYSSGDYSPGYTTLRWPMKRFGVDAVISAHDKNYQRTYADDVFWITVGTGDATTLQDPVTGLAINGHLELEATAPLLQFTFKDTEGGLRDRFTISA